MTVFFSFSTLNVFAHRLLDSKVSNEKRANNLIVYFNVFFLFSSDSVISIVLPLSLLILSSACSSLPLNHTSEFLILVIMLLSSRIWGGVVPLRFSFLKKYFHFIHHFLDLLHISFFSLSILKIVILRSFLGTVSVD